MDDGGSRLEMEGGRRSRESRIMMMMMMMMMRRRRRRRSRRRRRGWRSRTRDSVGSLSSFMIFLLMFRMSHLTKSGFHISACKALRLIIFSLKQRPIQRLESSTVGACFLMIACLDWGVFAPDSVRRFPCLLVPLCFRSGMKMSPGDAKRKSETQLTAAPNEYSKRQTHKPKM